MNFHDENNQNAIASSNTHLQGGGGEASVSQMMKVGASRRNLGLHEVRSRSNRRALSVLNQSSNYHPRVVINKTRPHQNIQKRGSGTGPLDPAAARKFATRFSSTLKESKKQKPLVPRPNAFGECIFVDADDSYKPDHDQPVPMSLEEQAEDSGIHEMNHTEEIEMEDITEEEESLVDIDELDAKNPLAVVDYVEEMYTYYKKMESHSCVSLDYMARQSDINEKMRAILVDWLIEVHDKFELMKETLFLTVSLVDRFLSQQPMARRKLQLVGLVAMLLACKYEEVSVPVVGDLIVISDKAYTRNEVLEMENLLLNKLQFNVSLPTPYVFMTRFLKAAQSDNKLEMLAFYLMELSLVEYEMLQFTPSLLAASAIYTAQCSLNGFKQWTTTCEWHTTYSEHHLIECSRKMVGFHEEAGTRKLTGVYRKYNTSKFGYTSTKCQPASFLLEKKTIAHSHSQQVV